jgi:hypothetical protein
VGALIKRKNATDRHMDRPIRCSSLMLEDEEHLKYGKLKVLENKVLKNILAKQRLSNGKMEIVA